MKVTLKAGPIVGGGGRALSSVWLERAAHNRVVGGSNPPGPSSLWRRPRATAVARVAGREQGGGFEHWNGASEASVVTEVQIRQGSPNRSEQHPIKLIG